MNDEFLCFQYLVDNILLSKQLDVENRLLNADNLDTLIQHSNRDSCVKAIHFILENDSFVFTDGVHQTHFNVIFKHHDPVTVTRSFSLLEGAGLLRGEEGEINRQLVAHAEHPMEKAEEIINAQEKDNDSQASMRLG